MEKTEKCKRKKRKISIEIYAEKKTHLIFL